MLQILFGNRIKELRTILDISQLELSNLTGIERAQISKIEQGKVNVTLETINKLSSALNVTIPELMSFEYVHDVKPFVKWAGGKTQLLTKLKEFMPKDYNIYYEPFVGGGALFFDLTPKMAYINDINSELISVYKCLKNQEDANRMIDELIKHEQNHNEEYYYQIREMDRNDNFITLPQYIRAARIIYLNKACFNGLYRVNAKGYFNVPSGHKEKVSTFDRNNMIELIRYFKDCSINVTQLDFEEAVKNAKKGDFVYFDPPYDVFPDKNGFVDYSKEGFGKEEQVRLAKVFKDLDEKGVYVMFSNHNTPFINELYSGYNIHIVEAKRMINSKSSGRGNVFEVIITNY
ncbi:MAG: Dam family site-specific DNA-(adenine-N6)-methyltransferase [Bacilli bacterium]|nr:Dam family site-specific DNA-(adenine-N6)-methyltransferase [Bacilli bacterium]